MLERMADAAAWGERHQVSLYLLAIAAGAAVGGLLPATAPWFALAVVPALALLCS